MALSRFVLGGIAAFGVALLTVPSAQAQFVVGGGGGYHRPHYHGYYAPIYATPVYVQPVIVVPVYGYPAYRPYYGSGFSYNNYGGYGYGGGYSSRPGFSFSFGRGFR